MSLLVTLAMFLGNGLALDQAWIQKTQAAIRKTISKSGVSQDKLGIYIAGNIGGKDTELFKLNEKKKMIPASITKLVTAAATLHYFPPGSKFKTELLTTAVQEHSTLKGDLVLKGGGDPSFVSESLWFLVNAFLRNQITVIEGDIVVDDSLFDQNRFDSSRQKTRVDNAYDAPTGAMSFNWNSVNVFIRPGKKVGEPALTFIDPENDYIGIRGSIKTVSGRTDKNMQVIDREASEEGKDVIALSGKIGLNDGERVVFRNVTQPDLWAGYNLKSFLKQRGIQVLGSIKNGVAATDARVLAVAESKPIEQIVADMNKFSNNYVAEMLTKQIATHKKVPGTIDVGEELIKKFLLESGINVDDFELPNPAGLSRDNRMTARSLWTLLYRMNASSSLQPEFASSLPIMGVDGTLKSRKKGNSNGRHIRAKTGLLTGVRSLAGFAGRSNGEVIQFVMMFNGPADVDTRELFDRIALQLVM